MFDNENITLLSANYLESLSHCNNKSDDILLNCVDFIVMHLPCYF